MKLAVVTTVHPATPHISAMRTWRFAQALAARGHQPVLICAGPAVGTAAPVRRPEPARHDWSRPLVLEVPAAPVRWTGRAFTLVRLLVDGGNLAPWTRAAVAAARGLIQDFRPDLVWTTFGRLEAVIAGRRIARVAGCPWVLDLKDNWELYVPAPLRRAMVRRISGWAALTANAEFNRDLARRGLGGEATVVYSGVDAAFLARAGHLDPGAGFAINLVGSLYDPRWLAVLLAGVRRWAAALAPEARRELRLVYLGADQRAFAAGLVRQPPGIAAASTGWVAVADLARACRGAGVNAYLFHPGTFHHKLLELLACGRPVLAVPGERAESRVLAAGTGGDLRTAASPAAVARELARAHTRWRAAVGPAPAGPFAPFGWDAQAAVLEGVLVGAAAAARFDPASDRAGQGVRR